MDDISGPQATGVASTAGDSLIKWWPVILAIVVFVISGAKDRAELSSLKEELSSYSDTMAELKGALGRMDVLEERTFTSKERAKEERAKVTRLQLQMGYRLRFEAMVRAIHPEVKWPD